MLYRSDNKYLYGFKNLTPVSMLFSELLTIFLFGHEVNYYIFELWLIHSADLLHTVISCVLTIGLRLAEWIFKKVKICQQHLRNILILKSSILIHLADPRSGPVVYFHTSLVRPSFPTLNINQIKQSCTCWTMLLFVGLWGWPCGSLMTRVLFYLIYFLFFLQISKSWSEKPEYAGNCSIQI